jgi:valyl-tRNA synthetase
VLAYVLERSLRLLHPFMPFVTEAIWRNLPGLGAAGAASIMVTRWPEALARVDAAAETDFGRVQEVVRAIRNVRSEYDVPAGRRIAAQISAGEFAPLMQASLPVTAMLARLDAGRVEIAASLPAPDKAATLAVAGVTVYLPLAGLVDLDAERKRMQGELDNIEKQIQRIATNLDNPGFTGKAPANVIEREQLKLAELREKREQVAARLGEL